MNTGVMQEDRGVGFPPSFLWGVAVASYQVEGGNLWSDWWEWERTPGHIKDASRNTIGCDFWNRYPYYLDLAKKIGLNAFRLSIEWGRVNPEKDRWSDEALTRYREIILACRERGMEPMVTLWHFTLPQWVSREGGWTNPETVDWFLAYVDKTVEALGDNVRFWITLNEPTIVLSSGYKTGVWPPGRKKDIVGFRQARKNLILCHRETFSRIKKKTPETQVGIAVNITYNEPYRPWLPPDRVLVFLANIQGDYAFLKRMQSHLDFIGLNYYFHSRLAFAFQPDTSFSAVKNENKIVSDFGWEVYPAGIAKVSWDLWRRFRKPIYITENGVADANMNDKLRSDFIRQHLLYLSRSIAQGVDVRGYFYWSLMDNFEWAEGFPYRSGLYAMDYEKQIAVPRQSSVETYRRIIAEHRISHGNL